jgi:hypothetical protein
VSDYIFAKFIWNIDPIYPSIGLIPIGKERYSELPIKIGEDFNIKLGERKLCIGTEVNAGKWITCIENQRNISIKMGKSVIANTYTEKEVDSDKQCTNCRTTNYFTCRMTCIGDVCIPKSDIAKTKCDPPVTSVYLTHVGGELKVGVSLGIKRRWLEQGSDYAIEIAKAPGLIARRLEQAIAKQTALKLQVRNTRKIRHLLPVTEESAQQEISLKIQEIHPIMVRYLENEEGEILSNPSLYNFTTLYGQLSFERQIDIIDPEPGIEFGGELVTIKGSIIIVKQGLYYYAMDTKRLVSHTIEFLDRPATNKREQAGLDEWF